MVSTDFIEAIFVDFFCNNKKFTIGSVFRPPHASSENFIYFMEMSLQMTSRGWNIFVCGDFNLDMLRMNGAGSDSYIFYNTFRSLSLQPVISELIRIIANTCTLIDNIITNNTGLHLSFF